MRNKWTNFGLEVMPLAFLMRKAKPRVTKKKD